MIEKLDELIDIIRGIRPHFEKTGLSCLEDCDEAIQIISDLKQQLAEMTSSRDFYKDENQSFGNVLAVIHCDGGHYITEHGHKKASQDAIKKWHKLNQLIAEAKAEIERLKEENKKLIQRQQIITESESEE